MEEFWKWPESSWSSSDIDWKSAKTITVGVDIGSTSTQAVIMCDGALFGYANIHTGVNFKKAGELALEKAMGASGMKLRDVSAVVATGWGSRRLALRTKTMIGELPCKGARFLLDRGTPVGTWGTDGCGLYVFRFGTACETYDE